MNEPLPKAKRRRLTRDNLSEKYSDTTEIRIAQRRQRQILTQYKNKRKQIPNTSIVDNKRQRKKDLKLQDNTMKIQISNHSSLSNKRQRKIEAEFGSTTAQLRHGASRRSNVLQKERKQDQSPSDSVSTSSERSNAVKRGVKRRHKKRKKMGKPQIALASDVIDSQRAPIANQFDKRKSPTTSNATKGKSSARPFLSSRWGSLLVFICISALLLFQKHNSRKPFQKDCIYVNGGGFSGFWFILGQLYKIHEQEQPENYVCYSAGCLGAVAVLANRSMDEVLDSAVSVQGNWQSGNISRYSVSETFVDDIIGRNSSLDASSLSKLNILTSVATNWGWKAEINRPQSLKELKQMLIQTAWIPFVTGPNIVDPLGHFDGVFSLLQHPTCGIEISLKWDLSLILNIFNINLAKEASKQFWKMGINHMR